MKISSLNSSNYGTIRASDEIINTHTPQLEHPTHIHSEQVEKICPDNFGQMMKMFLKSVAYILTAGIGTAPTSNCTYLPTKHKHEDNSRTDEDNSWNNNYLKSHYFERFSMTKK